MKTKIGSHRFGAASFGTLAVALLPCLACAATTADNLIWNADMRLNDGYGAASGWDKRVPNQRHNFADVEIHPTEDGVFVLDIWGPKGMVWVVQEKLTLKSGGRYRLSCDVQTAGLEGGELTLRVWDDGWHQGHRTPPFPSDTKGGWKTVEYVGNIVCKDGANPSNYTVSLFAEFTRQGRLRAKIRNLSLVALDGETAAASKPRPAVDTPTYPIRIVPIDPLLAEVSHETGRMTFYWPGLPPCGVANCRLAGRVDGGKAVVA